MVYKLLRILTVVIIGFGSLTNDARAADKPGYGGTLRWGTRARPTALNPVITSYSISMSLFDLLFDGLVRINERCEIEPDLAESWEISEDGRVYTFHLRRDVRFHDGTPCTAQDVQFTYNLIIRQEGDSPFSASMLGNVGWYEAAGDYTFRIGLEEPSASFLYKMTKGIVPRHLLEGVDLNTAEFNRHPVGTGPFRFREWLPDDTLVLEANPDYREGRPYLDRIEVKTYQDTRAVWVALMREEIDFMLFLESDDYNIVKQDPVFRAYEVPIDCYYALSYDLNDPVYSDIRVRRAIAHSLDIDQLIRRAAGGYGARAAGPFQQTPDVGNKAIGYDPDQARHLLRSAGWRDENGDGIFDKNGQDLELRVLADLSRKVNQRIMMALRQQLCTVGLRLRVIAFQDPAEVTAGFLEQHRPQALLRIMYGGSMPDEVGMEWDPDNAQRAFNPWPYRNKDVIGLFRKACVTIDEAGRQALYTEINNRIYVEQPVCFLFFPSLFHAVSARFENTDEFFNVNMPFYTIADWYVPQNNRKRVTADAR